MTAPEPRRAVGNRITATPATRGNEGHSVQNYRSRRAISPLNRDNNTLRHHHSHSQEVRRRPRARAVLQRRLQVGARGKPALGSTSTQRTIGGSGGRPTHRGGTPMGTAGTGPARTPGRAARPTARRRGNATAAGGASGEDPLSLVPSSMPPGRSRAGSNPSLEYPWK